MNPDDRSDDAPAERGVPASLLDHLYGLPLDEFVAARDAAARDARVSGDRPGARQIAALPKPTVAAWMVDQAVRTVPHAVDAVADLGDDLRDATARGDRQRIVALDRERRRVLDALMEGVADTVRPGGRPASEATLRAVRDTFVAALADPDAAAAVQAGRLARGLEHVGLGLVDESGQPVELPVAPRESADHAAKPREGSAKPRDGSTKPGGARAGRGAARSGGPAPATAADETRTARKAAAERAVAEHAEALDRAEEALDAARATHDEQKAALRTATDALDQADRAVADLEAEIVRRRAERDARAAAADDARQAAGAAAAEVARHEDEVAAAEDAAAGARRSLRAARRGS